MQLLSSLALVATLALGIAEATPTATSPELVERYGGQQSSKPGSCSNKNDFWYNTRQCCLPHNGPSKPSTPPNGSSCPSSWYWHYGQGCCVPKHPNPPTPTCGKGWGWSSGRQCCTPNKPPPPPPSPPKPSSKPGGGSHGGGNNNGGGYNGGSKNGGGYNGGYNGGSKNGGGYNGGYGSSNNNGHGNNGHYKVKRNFDSQWDLSFCPTGLTTCPIRVGNVLSSDAECVDTLSDIASCGGCASLGKGLDCSKIRHATLSSCQGGYCVVEECSAGFKPSDDESFCVRA